MRLKYTLCFIRRGSQLLMLNRNYSPNMGLWNGVGGKLKNDETPLDGILREALEETGIQLEKIRFSGTVTWNLDYGDSSGLYVYIAELSEDYVFPTPLPTLEGILDWKDISWVVDPHNLGVVSNIPIFLPKMLTEQTCRDFNFTYKEEEIVSYTGSILCSAKT